MKGLLLKDVYMIEKYCKSFLLMIAVFIFIPFVIGENMFFVFYPSILCAMLPTSLIGYDEKSGWNRYCGALPYTKMQIVSGKYIINAVTGLAVIALTAIVQAIQINSKGAFGAAEYFILLSFSLALFCFSSAVSLPLMFKFGVEKASLIRLVLFGIFFGCCGAASAVFKNTLNVQWTLPLAVVLTGLCIVSIVVYVISWYLSYIFYKNREV